VADAPRNAGQNAVNTAGFAMYNQFMPPLWVVAVAAISVATTGVLTWILWRINGGGRGDDGAGQ
jgi:hypothetical protein